jgi:hypothetical protein
LSSATPQSSPLFKISGTVVDAIKSEPVARANLSIQSVPDRETRTATADAKGRFTFDGVPPGKYALTAEARGFTRQGYDQHEGFFSAIVAGPGLISEGLVFRLKPDAVITVKVRDEFDEPVRTGTARLFQEEMEEGRQQVRLRGLAPLNEEGIGNFAHLPAGKYFVAVTAQPWYAQQYSPGSGADGRASLLDVAYPITYYGNTTEPAAASPIRVQMGERTTAEVILTAVPSAHLEIVLPDESAGASDGATLEQLSFGGYPIEVEVQGVQTRPDHVQFHGFAPGHYRLNLYRFADRKTTTRHREIDIAGDMDIESDGSELAAHPAVSGTVSFEGMTGVPPQALLQLIDSRSAQTVAAQISAAGEFEISGDVAPGRYELQVANAPGFAIDRLTAAGARVRGTSLEIDSSDSVRLKVTASRALSKVEGVALQNKQPVAGAMVILVPRDPQASPARFRRDQSDSDGTFTLAAVLPGDYTVIAVGNWNLEWANRSILRPYLSRGQNLHVEANKQYQVAPQVQ